ncbi:MAG: GDP-mannose 4,6-dehydratase [Gemmataceae bacterium]|nr:GDP-mannose 4,6-dehydratase [Gemmataceae bacterium]
MRKLAVIWGITGQDGSYLAELLLNKRYERVVGVRRRTSVNNDERLRSAMRDDRFELIYGDVTDAASVNAIIRHYHPTEVYNLAAQSHVKVSFDEPSHTWAATAGGALNILEAIRQEAAWPGEMRYYQASSSEMFGSQFTVTADGRCQGEYTPMVPNSPYAIAKLAAHHTARLYREAYGLHASSGILFNHESERRGDTFVTRKISQWVAQVALSRKWKAKPPELCLGNIESHRDWGHAQDYVYAMWLMLQQEKPDDYVIATGHTHTVKQFLDRALAVIGVTESQGLYRIDHSLYRPSEVPFLRGDSTKARNVLGWKPEICFDELVRRMVLHDAGQLGLDMAGTTSGTRRQELGGPAVQSLATSGLST